MIGKNKAKKIIEDSNEDEWVHGRYNSSNFLLTTDDKTKNAFNSKKSIQFDSESSINNNAIVDNIIDTTLLSLKNKVNNGDGISCTISGIPILHEKKKAKRVWWILLNNGADGDLLFVHPHTTTKYIPCKDHHMA